MIGLGRFNRRQLFLRKTKGFPAEPVETLRSLLELLPPAFCIVGYGGSSFKNTNNKIDIMKKRLAKKALSLGYYNVWCHPDTGRRMLVPRNAHCWGIIQRAYSHFGHPEWMEKYCSEIMEQGSFEG